MATPNVGILTTAGKALIDKVNSGQAKISFSKVVFSSMDNSQLSDTQIKALTAIAPQEVVVSSPETTLDTNSGETRIRATGTNEKLADGVYVKTYGVFAKDDTGSEILYGVTVSPNPNYFPAYDGVTPQAVTYSYKTVIQETSNITMTNSNDVYVSQEDLTEAIAKIPQPDLSGYDRTDDVDKKLQNKQDKLDYTPADDSKVTHNTGDEEIAGKKTFDTAPIDKTTGNPYITKDGVPAVPSTLADTAKPANFTAGLQSGGVDVATAADLKSLEASAWKLLVNSDATTAFYRLVDGTLYISGYARVGGNYGKTYASLKIVNKLPTELQNKVWTIKNKMTVGLDTDYGSIDSDLVIGKDYSLTATTSDSRANTNDGIVIFNNSYTQK